MVPAVTPDAAVTSANPSSSLETHSVPPPAGGPPAPAEPASGASRENAGAPHTSSPVAEMAPPPDAPLGSPRRKTTAPAAQSDPAANYLPRTGQTFLQVAAVRRNEADGIADVLNKKGFHAHSVPKPGNTAVYRVLIGPIRNTAELSSTRDELRKTGFRDVIVQRY